MTLVAGVPQNARDCQQSERDQENRLMIVMYQIRQPVTRVVFEIHPSDVVFNRQACTCRCGVSRSQGFWADVCNSRAESVVCCDCPVNRNRRAERRGCQQKTAKDSQFKAGLRVAKAFVRYKPAVHRPTLVKRAGDSAGSKRSLVSLLGFTQSRNPVSVGNSVETWEGGVSAMKFALLGFIPFSIPYMISKKHLKCKYNVK